MTPRSRPTLSTTSSIRPRVFIRIPRLAASRQLHASQARGRQRASEFAGRRHDDDQRRRAAIRPDRRRSPISVRMPVSAKKAGSRRTVTDTSSLSIKVRATRLSCGMMAPKRNAPKMACTPICSVIRADTQQCRRVPPQARRASVLHHAIGRRDARRSDVRRRTWRR